jgi:hypothetical protein
MKFPWIYTFIGASGIDMGFRESLFAMGTGACLKSIQQSKCNRFKTSVLSLRRGLKIIAVL